MFKDFSKPWNSPALNPPAEIYLPRGMLGDEERRCLYWMGKHGLTGTGVIVDAGAYIGSSAYCFAAGAACNPAVGWGKPVVHSYDYFVSFDDYVAKAITETIRPQAVGESYLDIFEYQTGKYKELIRAYPGDFLGHAWSGELIDVCFIDVAKTQALNAHVINQFFPCLEPGRSYVIHQDFYHCWHPYIHISMEILSDFFDLVDGHVFWQSRVYKLARPIPAELIARLAKWEVSKEEEIKMLDRFIVGEGETCLMKGMAYAVKLWRLCEHGDRERFESTWKQFTQAMPEWESSSELWAVQAKEVASNFLNT